MSTSIRNIGVLIWLLLLASSCRQSSVSNNLAITERKEFIHDLDLDKIRARGYITALMDNSSTGLFIYRGKTMGYEYELLKRYSDELGVELRIDITPSLEEAFNKLNTGVGDIMAYNLTVTKERKKRIAFTHYHNQQHLVLIQRKPEGWRELKYHEIEAQLIRNPIDLIGKEVTVRWHSSYYDRLANLSEEIGGDILITPGDNQMETEQLIRAVAEGEMDYTVAENNIALVNSTYYRNLDIKTAISFPQQISWGIRKNAPDLLNSLNGWIEKMRKTTDYYVIYDKYFKSSKASLARSRSKYSTMSGGHISPYDSLIKHAALELGWDWRLLAAQIFKESKFDRKAKSWAGAIGLMQVLPRTAKDYNVTNLTNPARNIHAGTMHLLWLQNLWRNDIEDKDELIKFVLASYNVGRGHVLDAVRLTQKYGGNTAKWSDVREFLLKKSYTKYFNDPVVEFGYCRGMEPVGYVDEILEVFSNYKAIINPDQRIVASNLY
ncbi:MAG: transporter substrate-binding domain-containing protein [Cyclobacteriaceae bacterium]